MRISAWRRFLFLTLINLGIWTFAALVSTDVVVSNARQEGIEVGWDHVLSGQLATWLPWAIASWLIFRVSRRLHRQGGPWWRKVLVHLAVWLLWSLCYTFFLYRSAPDPQAWLRAVFAWPTSPWQWFDPLVYLVIVGLAYGTLFYGDYVAQARRTAELRERLARAELAALRARLDPHFLFNSLNTVSALVRTSNPEGALDAIARLSDLLRAVLATRDRTWVRLEDELQIADAYLALLKLRFADQLEVRVEVDDACRAARVPDMLLLPLLENAVRHGAVGGVPRYLALTARLRQDTVRLTVVNRRGDGDSKEPGGFGIGLETTRQRLQRLFGSAASLELETAADDRVRTRLIFPLQTSSSPEEPLAAGIRG